MAGMAPEVPYPAASSIEETRRGARRWRAPLLLAATLLSVAAAWIGAPYATARNLAAAVEANNQEGLAAHLDIAALQVSVRDALVPGPLAPRDGQAGAFLSAMAGEMAAAWAQPAALAEVMRARGLVPGAAAEGLRQAMPVGLTRFEMPLATRVAPMALQLDLRGEGLRPRWQVTGVRLEAPPARQVAAPSPRRELIPPAESAPPIRLTALR